MTTTPPVILVTSFGPFRIYRRNPSTGLVDRLADAGPGYRIERLRLATTWKAADEVISRAEEIGPVAIVMFGLKDISTGLRFERTATSAAGRGRDVDGKHAPALALNSLRSTVPVEAMAEAALKHCRAQVSGCAGTFVCNRTLFTVLSRFGAGDPSCGFVHVPLWAAHWGPLVSGADAALAELAKHFAPMLAPRSL